MLRGGLALSTIAASAGYEIRREGARVLFVDRGARGLGIAAAVIGGLCGMAWIWTIVLAGMAFGDPALGFMPSVVVFGIAAGTTALTVWALRSRKTARTADVTPMLVADVTRGVLLDGQGRDVAPVAQCRVVKAMLISSSAPSVQLRWPGGKREIYRGSIMGGGVSHVLDALRQLGFSR